MNKVTPQDKMMNGLVFGKNIVAHLIAKKLILMVQFQNKKKTIVYGIMKTEFLEKCYLLTQK